jgi:RHS repeat-associated protein
LAGANGIAVVGQSAVVANGYQLMRVDRTSGAVSVLAGSSSGSSCTDAPDGAGAQFSGGNSYPLSPLRVIGGDGTFAYVADGCGLRRVDPTSGATLTLNSMRNTWTSITGQYVYGRSNNTIYRWDLTTGTSKTISTSAPSGQVVGDATNVWIIHAGTRAVHRMAVDTGTSVMLTNQLPLPATSDATPTAVLSVGDYLYLNVNNGTSYFPSLARINKTSGFMEVIAGSGVAGYADGVYTDAQFGNITGIAAADGKFYIADTHYAFGARVRVVRAVKRPVAIGGPSLYRETVGGYNLAGYAPCNACHGDPVQTDTGALLEPVKDLETAGRGLALTMARTYSSTAAETSTAVGYGWAWRYGMNLTQPANQQGQVLITQENGSVVTFARQDDGSYKAAPRVQATLVRNSDGTWTFDRKREVTFTFAADGKLRTETDRFGNTSTAGYNSAGRLATMTDPAGRVLTFTYDSAGKLATATAPSGMKVAYTHNAAGDLTAVTDAAGATTSYAYTAQHLLTSVTRPRGGVMTNVYDQARRVVSQTDQVGNVWTFAYLDGDSTGSSTVTVTNPGGDRTVEEYVDGQLRSQTNAAGTPEAATTTYEYDEATSQPTVVTDPTGSQTRYTYDAAGNQLTATDPLGRTTNWTYDSDNNPTSVTNPAGNITTNTYDSAGNLLTTTTPTGRVTTNTYNPTGTLATTTTAGGRTTRYTYTSAGTVASVVGPDNRTTSFGYDADGRKVTVTDNTGKTTTDTLDAGGRVIKTTDPDGRTTGSAYNADSQKTRVEDGAGNPTTSSYDLAGRLTATVEPRGATTSYTYTAAGKVSAVTDPAGNTVETTYDLLGNPVSITDAGGRTTTTTYTKLGQPLTSTSPTGAVTSTQYDAAGQVTAVIDAAGHRTSYEYDLAGRRTTVTDPNGRVTRTAYDPDGRVVTVTAADGGVTRTAYNPDGQPIAETNADGRTTTYTYNAAGELVTRTAPGGLVTGYTYDAAGRQAVMTQPDGRTVTRSYTPGGQLTGIDYSDGATPDVDYTYDTTGRRITMTDGTGTTTYTYDAAGRITTARNGAGAVTRYEYDLIGRLVTLTYPGGETVTSTYNSAGDLTSTTDWNGNTTTYTSDAAGRQTSQTYPNGVTTTYQYTPTGLLAAATISKDGTTYSAAAYSYDPADQLTGDVRDGVTRSYTYTPSSQLSTVAITEPDKPTSTQTYTTTPGAVLTKLGNGTSLTYNTAGQLTTSTPASGATTSYTFDRNGNRTAAATEGATVRYRYNQANQIISAETPAGAVTYTVDGAGMRQSRTADGTTDAFTWTAAGALPLLLSDGGHRYLYGAGITPYAQVAVDGTIEYLHTDHLGSVVLITDAAGAIAGRNSFDPYGTLTAHAGTATSAIGFTGNWTDPDTGLIHLRARDYDPTTGQFLAVDPLADATGDIYTYAANNPIQNTDPDGKWCLTGTTSSGRCRGMDTFDKIILSEPSNVLHDVFLPQWRVDLMVGAADAASFGIGAWARNKFFPSAACVVNTKSGWYSAGGVAAVFIPGGGAAKGASLGAAAAGSRVPRFIATSAGVTIDRASVKTAVSAQKQARHVIGTPQYRGGGYFNNRNEAQEVLDAFHAGRVEVMGVTNGGHVQVRYTGVTGYNNNPAAGYVGQPTNIFMIKGTSSPSIVPISPLGIL